MCLSHAWPGGLRFCCGLDSTYDARMLLDFFHYAVLLAT